MTGSSQQLDGHQRDDLLFSDHFRQRWPFGAFDRFIRYWNLWDREDDFVRHFHHLRLRLAWPPKVTTMDCYCAGERRPQVAQERQVFLITSKGMALYYVGFYIRFDPPVSGTPVTAPGYIALIAIYIFAAVYQFGWGPVVWTYCSVCPLRMDF